MPADPNANAASSHDQPRLVIDCARIVIETTSPLSLGSGEADGRYDVLLRRDANGLPVIPATTLAGALRAEYALIASPELVETVFGRARPEGSGRRAKRPVDSLAAAKREASRLVVSDALVHDASDRPVDGLVLPGDRRIEADAVLSRLLAEQPVLRDHVRLDHRGVADDRGKFDRGAVPAGCRFSFDLTLHHDGALGGELDRIVELLRDGAIAFGGATKRGYGAVKLARFWRDTFPLRHPGKPGDAKALQRYARWPVTLADSPRDPPKVDPKPAQRDDIIVITLHAVDGWRIGGGDRAMTTTRDGVKTPDALPYAEARIDWTRGSPLDRARWQDHADIVVPGSSTRGALRHRTTFHLNVILKRFAGAQLRDEPEPEEIETLFGSVKRDGDDDGTGRAGRLIVQDIRLPEARLENWTLTHNAIDRFTGGTIDQVLFSEQLVWSGEKPLELRLRLRDAAAVPAPVRLAFRRALRDLVEARLPLGAAAAKGHGFMTGRWDPRFDAPGHWLAERST